MRFSLDRGGWGGVAHVITFSLPGMIWHLEKLGCGFIENDNVQLCISVVVCFVVFYPKLTLPYWQISLS